MEQAFDIVVIGGGPGGYVAAIRAARLGQRVALVEKERPGGVCLNWGCIPTKAMVRSAEVLETVRRAADYGIVTTGARLDYSAVLARRDGVVRDLTNGIARLLEANGVTVFAGHARFTDPHTVAVHETAKPAAGDADTPRYAAPPVAGAPYISLTGRNIVIATGSRPLTPRLEGADLPGVITSDGAFGLRAVPRRVVVVGGSAIGAEWAGLLHSFGAEVTIVEIMPTLVPAEDVEIARMLTRSFAKRGIRVLNSHTVTGIRQDSGGLLVGVEKTDKESDEVSADIVLFGIGRRPNTADLGLDRAGVQTDSRGYIPVDDTLRTNVGHIRAIGDVTGRRQLAHVASHQGLVAASSICGHEEGVDYSVIPAATFTHPEVASVGLTEAQAVRDGFEVSVARFPFAALGRAHTYGETEGMAKIVADATSGRVLGAHIIGPGASDLIAESTLALSHDATLASIAETIHAHPTLSEVTWEASLSALGMPVHAAPRRSRNSRF
ncbi:dihydrolipoyl dehydrogenase [Streptomyces sp. NPDC087908]|uniref:dihydrolipoyl dehydrogenase n=1 Tax=Streptomyces sp. NPDC087908 TaxID=3365820 RepID=UPI00382DB711